MSLYDQFANLRPRRPARFVHVAQGALLRVKTRYIAGFARWL
jgi:hypothetical protein